MAQIVMVLGDSGKGKTTSLRNFKAEEIGYISAIGKALPFKTDIKPFKPNNYDQLLKVIEQSVAPVIVIDDFNYFMTNVEFEKINELGYGKFTEMAKNVVKVFNAIARKDSDQLFYILGHTEEDEKGQLRLKTTGKMVRDKFVPEGYTNQVIEAFVDDGEFKFLVQANGKGVKTPYGMFSEEAIENDLELVDKTMREFYGLTSREDMVKKAKENKKVNK